MNIGQKLQLLREEYNWSQEDIATKMNVTSQLVSRWELNEVMPDAENVIDLCKLFHVSADTLLNSDFDIDSNSIFDKRKMTKSSLRERSLKSGILFLIIGILILGTLLTLSQIVPSRLKVTESNTANDISYISDKDATDTKELRTVYYYITVKEFIPFLNTYYLHWVLVLGCVCICLSIFYFVRFKIVNNLAKNKKGEVNNV